MLSIFFALGVGIAIVCNVEVYCMGKVWPSFYVITGQVDENNHSHKSVTIPGEKVIAHHRMAVFDGERHGV